MKRKETYQKFMNHYILSYEDVLTLKDDEILLVNTSFLYYTLAYYQTIDKLTTEKQFLIQEALNSKKNKNLTDPRFTSMRVLDIKRIYQGFPKNLFHKTSFLKQALKNLTPENAYNLLIQGVIQNENDFEKPENKWINHSIYVGLAAKRIAQKLGLDENLAEALGYIHDIGRKIDHFNHPIEGYRYMTKLGYVDQAGICLTHSFINNDITVTAGGGPKEKEKYEYINSYLQSNPPTIYDNIIQLCDLFCLENGFTTIESRILDITKRKGIFENSLNHFQETMKLKERFEMLMHCNLYDLFPEIKRKDIDNIQNNHDELIKLLEAKSIKK